jgi:hypothetical protein
MLTILINTYKKYLFSTVFLTVTKLIIASLRNQTAKTKGRMLAPIVIFSKKNKPTKKSIIPTSGINLEFFCSVVLSRLFKNISKTPLTKAINPKTTVKAIKSDAGFLKARIESLTHKSHLL